MKLILAFILAALSSTAAAQNWVGLLKNTPAELFDEEDLRLFLDTSRKALNEAPDGQTLTWENPKTRARGEVTVRRSFESKGRPCKDLQLRNQAGGRKGESNVSLCKVEDKWRLLSAQQLKK